MSRITWAHDSWSYITPSRKYLSSIPSTAYNCCIVFCQTIRQRNSFPLYHCWFSLSVDAISDIHNFNLFFPAIFLLQALPCSLPYYALNFDPFLPTVCMSSVRILQRYDSLYSYLSSEYFKKVLVLLELFYYLDKNTFHSTFPLKLSQLLRLENNLA